MAENCDALIVDELGTFSESIEPVAPANFGHREVPVGFGFPLEAKFVHAATSWFDSLVSVKLAGAALLLAMGVLSLRGRPADGYEPDERPVRRPRSDWAGLRAGLLTSLANPKLAVFFVALFPQFVPHGAPVLPAALVMAGVIVAFDLVWYSALALVVHRAKRAFAGGRWNRRVERLTGAVLVALGVRLALERP
jgi:threonine/homoserine/homoserine lactone efflux protein